MLVLRAQASGPVREVEQAVACQRVWEASLEAVACGGVEVAVACR
jgi:hypothetical protein